MIERAFDIPFISRLALRAEIEECIGHLYRTTCQICGNADAHVKYFLWIKVLPCEKCGKFIDLFPGYLVAKDRRHPNKADSNKADSAEGTASLKSLADLGAPYAMLLYERFLGRPFAGHRDSVSELVGDLLESAIENVLIQAGISFRKTKRAEIVPGFDQTPDFIIPSEFNPQVVIEAKLTEGDGTARDKVTRIQHLGQLSMAGQTGDQPKYEVIACIGGRGFGVRKKDMEKMLLATRGKVFTLKTINHLVQCTRLKEFVSKE